MSTRLGPKVSTALIIFAFCIVFMTVRAEASLISMDSSFGPGTVTFDTQTGLRWLDVPISGPYSYNGTLAELGPGGVFDGYRIATIAEVQTLLHNAGIPYFGNAFVPENYQPIKDLMSYVGITGHDGNLGTGIPFDFTVGHVLEMVINLPGWVNVIDISVYEPDQTGRASLGMVPVDNNNPEHGTWLVATRVPEPATLLLFGAGLAGIGIFRKRMKA